MEEPLKVLLKDAIVATSESVENGVQSGLQSVTTPASITQLNEVFANLRDEVTVKIHAGIGVAILRESLNSGVIELPELFAIADSFDHLSFDLTHWVSPLVDALSMARLGAFCKRPCATLPTVPAPGPLVQAYYLDCQPDCPICAHRKLIVPHEMCCLLVATLLFLHHPTYCVREMFKPFCLFTVDLHCVKLESFEDKLKASNEEDGHK